MYKEKQESINANNINFSGAMPKMLLSQQYSDLDQSKYYN